MASKKRKFDLISRQADPYERASIPRQQEMRTLKRLKFNYFVDAGKDRKCMSCRKVKTHSPKRVPPSQSGLLTLNLKPFVRLSEQPR